MLKRLLRRNPDNGPKQPPTHKRGHGDHWGCVYVDPRRDGLLQAIERLVSSAKPSHGRDGVALYQAGSDSLRMSVLVRGRSMETAFPEVTSDYAWPIELTSILPWSNGLEAQLTGACSGATVSFFDTRYYGNCGRYRKGETYTFRMGALAYRLGPAQELEAEVEGGAKVSFKGAHAYMPASMGGEGADIDDYWFHSPLGGPIAETTLNGIELRGYPITLALPNDFEMSLTLYAAPHAEAPGTRDLSPGDDLQGYLWLQGYLE